MSPAGLQADTAARTVIAYVNDAEHALRQWQAWPSGDGPQHWILIACAPRATQRIGRWVSQASREHWRHRWVDKLTAALAPVLRARGHRVSTVLADGPLGLLTQRLCAEHGQAQLLDARKPRAEGCGPALGTGIDPH